MKILVVAFSIVACLSGCYASESRDNLDDPRSDDYRPPTPLQPEVYVSPGSITLYTEGTTRFAYSVTPASGGAVLWRVDEGSVGGEVFRDGTYRAPKVPGKFHVSAVLASNHSVSGRAQITVIEKPIPFVENLTPSSGVAGTTVVLTGRNFGDTLNNAEVTFGGLPAIISSWSSTSISTKVPNEIAVGTHAVKVKIDGQVFAAGDFVVVPNGLSLSPITGAVGTVITITGPKFGTTGSVNVGGVAASVQTWSNTTILAVIPSGLPVAQHAVVVTPAGGASVSAGGFTVLPATTSLSPIAASTTTVVTLHGTSFGNSPAGNVLTVGGSIVASITWIDSAIVFRLPTNLQAGTALVCVNVNGFDSNCTPLSVLPVIEGISQTLVTAGQNITISGKSFGDAGEVRIGNGSASIISWSQSSIVATVPGTAGGGFQNVVVVSHGASSLGVPLQLTPGIDGLTPNNGPTGTTVVVSGTNFGSTQGNSSVTIGGNAAAITSWANTQITMRVPSNIGMGPQSVIVWVSSQASNASSFQVSPNISEIAPATTSVGSNVTITGTAFGAAQLGGTVKFGGNNAVVSSWSNTAITAKVPSACSAGLTTVVVTAGGYQSNTAYVSVVPVIASVSPAAATRGTTVTLSGLSFGASKGTSSLLLGGLVVAPRSWSDASISFDIPDSTASGSVSVVVFVNGQASNSSNILVLGGSIQIDSVTPQQGGEGTLVTIRGSGFGDSALGKALLFGGAATTSTRWSASAITVEVPRFADSGTLPVQIFESGTASNVAYFEYQRLWINRRFPYAVTRGNEITVFGRYFGAATGSAFIAGADADVVSWSDTRVTMLVPETVQKGWSSLGITSATGKRSNLVGVTVRGHGVWYSDDVPDNQANGKTVWTGNEMIVWGGNQQRTGFRYNPVSDSWLQVTERGAPAGRDGHTAVWTGKAMLIWGGNTSNTGGAYDPATDSWTSISLSGPGGRSYHSAVWTNSAMIIWGGRSASDTNLSNGGSYYPITNTWQPVSIDGAPSARSFHSAVWTGNEMIVWGGFGPTDSSGGVFSPSVNAWRPTATLDSPEQRRNHIAIWSGSEMIVWGGENGCLYVPPNRDGCRMLNTGGRYMPTTDMWLPTTQSGAPQGRIASTFGWTGKELIVWNGDPGYWGGGVMAGGIYSPRTDTWRAMANGLGNGTRSSSYFAWSGTELIVWDGGGYSSGAKYNVAADSWTSMAKSTPLPLSGDWVSGGGKLYTTGMQYDPATDTYLPIAARPSSSGPGGKLWWNGYLYESGALYRPATNTWLVMNPSGRPSSSSTAVGTPPQGIVVWGSISGSLDGNGVRYEVSYDTWNPISSIGAPTARNGSYSVTIGDKVIICGGYGGTTDPRTGGVYDAALDSWYSMPITNSPCGQNKAAVVQTNSGMIVWGAEGIGCVYAQNTGARYELATNTWHPITTINAPTKRWAAVGIWTGSSLVIWGGDCIWDGSTSAGGEYFPESDSWQPFASAPVVDKTAKGVFFGHEALYTIRGKVFRYIP